MKKILVVSICLLGLFTTSLWAGDRIKLEGAAQKELQTLLTANDKLHQSFFHYDAKKATANAKKVAKLITQLKNSKIRKLLSFSVKKLEMISATHTKKENNKLMNTYWMALSHVIKMYDVGEGYNEFYCPMVKKFWVEKSKDVHNPYSAMMPSCGDRKTNF